MTRMNNSSPAGAAPNPLDQPSPPATPGPWFQSHRQTGPEAWNTQVYDSKGVTIATLDWYVVRQPGGVIATARESNARLIAAAPDLLEACEDALDQLWHLAKDKVNNAWLKQLRAAIEKAKGPAPAAEPKSSEHP